MIIEVRRSVFTKNATISDVFVDGIWFCHMLEDVDRGLDKRWVLEDIQQTKVYAQTAIPAGDYILAVTYSPRFKSYLPLAMNVPGYKGIRIHPGNNKEHTAGCLLPGEFVPGRPDYVKNSRSTFRKLFKQIREAQQKERIILRVTRKDGFKLAV